MRPAVGTARRGSASRAEVLDTRPLAELLALRAAPDRLAVVMRAERPGIHGAPRGEDHEMLEQERAAADSGPDAPAPGTPEPAPSPDPAPSPQPPPGTPNPGPAAADDQPPEAEAPDAADAD